MFERRKKIKDKIAPEQQKRGAQAYETKHRSPQAFPTGEHLHETGHHMSWLGLADATERRFSLRGIGSDRAEHRRHPDADGYVLPRGTLLFETRMVPDAQPHVLLGYNQTWPEHRSLSFHAVPGGGVSVVQVAGDDIAHGALQHKVTARTHILRVSFSWDAPNGWAQFTVERPETFGFSSRLIKGVRPIPLAQLRNMIMRRDDTRFHKDLIYAALSDAIEPVGPMPSLAPGTLVETPDGYRQAGSLRRGDLVRTRTGETVPVLYRVTRTVPARGSFAPLRLRAPYFGLRQDIVVAPHQRLVIGGSEVEYLFNTDAVLVPVRHLVNGFAAQKGTAGPTTRFAQVILPRHEAILATGTTLESLYIGRLRRHRAQFDATLLAEFERAQMPEHGHPVCKELQWYDAVHLARRHAA